MTEHELLRIIAFLERVRLPFQELIPIAEEDATWNMLLYLIKNHLTGKAGNDDEAARVDRLGVARLDVRRDRNDAVAWPELAALGGGSFFQLVNLAVVEMPRRQLHSLQQASTFPLT